jgi:hypothetical protein
MHATGPTVMWTCGKNYSRPSYTSLQGPGESSVRELHPIENRGRLSQRCCNPDLQLGAFVHIVACSGHVPYTERSHLFKAAFTESQWHALNISPQATTMHQLNLAFYITLWLACTTRKTVTIKTTVGPSLMHCHNALTGQQQMARVHGKIPSNAPSSFISDLYHSHSFMFPTTSPFCEHEHYNNSLM